MDKDETASDPAREASLSPLAPAAQTLIAAGLGAIACLGVGLGRSDGSEPWLANALALALLIGGLALGGVRARTVRACLRAAARRDASMAARAEGLALGALALTAAHAVIWLPFDARQWPLGLVAGVAAGASVLASGLDLARRAEVPRWSATPTPLLLLALAGAGGLLALSAIENALGFAPGLVVWKAALALIGAGLAAQLWNAQAEQAGAAAAQAERSHGPFLEAPVFARARARRGLLRLVAIGLGLGVPVLCAVAADFLSGGFWMPVAFLSHLLGVAALRLLFLAEAEEVEPAGE